MTAIVFKYLGMIVAFVLPFFNLPLIQRIIERKSSADISLTWLFGVWICTILLLPAGLLSDDIAFKIFNIVNVILFSAVVITVMKYRGKNGTTK